jgi:hypothetical protein
MGSLLLSLLRRTVAMLCLLARYAHAPLIGTPRPHDVRARCVSPGPMTLIVAPSCDTFSRGTRPADSVAGEGPEVAHTAAGAAHPQGSAGSCDRSESSGCCRSRGIVGFSGPHDDRERKVPYTTGDGAGTDESRGGASWPRVCSQRTSALVKVVTVKGNPTGPEFPYECKCCLLAACRPVPREGGPVRS